jgi:hypothetical protein
MEQSLWENEGHSPDEEVSVLNPDSQLDQHFVVQEYSCSDALR